MSTHPDASGYVLIDRRDKPIEYASGIVCLHIIAEKLFSQDGRQCRIVTGAEFMLMRQRKRIRASEHDTWEPIGKAALRVVEGLKGHKT